MARGQRDELIAPVGEERVGGDEKGIDALFSKRRQGCVDLALGAYMASVKLGCAGGAPRLPMALRPCKQCWRPR